MVIKKRSRSAVSLPPKSLKSYAGGPDASPDGPLTDGQLAFANFVAEHNMTYTAAARAAGYGGEPGKMGSELAANPKVARAIAERRAEYAAASQVTKKMVIDGLLESINMAKTKAEPLTMIAGWREVGKMCGFYEPIKTRLEVSVSGKVLVEKLSAMSDEELLRLTQDQDPDIIDGIVTDITSKESNGPEADPGSS